METDKRSTWWDRKFMRSLFHDHDSQYAGGFLVLATYVDDQGMMDYHKAVDALEAADSELNRIQAESLLARYIEAGLIVVKGQTLVFPGCGTVFIPNQE